MSFDLLRRLTAMEERIAALERDLAAHRAALVLADEDELPRRKPGRPRRDQEKEAQA